MRVSPIPKSPGRRNAGDRGIIGIYPMRGGWGGPKRSIRQSLQDKAGRYGDLGAPYIIAVNSISKRRTDTWDFVDALYGTEGFAPDLQTMGLRQVRHPDGLFYGPHGEQNTRVSAVLFCVAHPWTLAGAPMILYHNPWATHPIEQAALPVPQCVLQETQLQPIEGQPLRQVLGLPEDWPGEEEEYEEQNRITTSYPPIY